MFIGALDGCAWARNINPWVNTVNAVVTKVVDPTHRTRRNARWDETRGRIVWFKSAKCDHEHSTREAEVTRVGDLRSPEGVETYLSDDS